MIGTTLGHYRIVSKIGQGGMGVVYRAHDERLDREVAVKVLPEELAADPERVARFEREARAVARLDHPNILAIHDFGAEGGISYAVTELLEGETLREHLARRGMAWQRVAEFGAAVAEGLAAAHARGVVHRDLKPENLFLTSDGRVKILDFGLARVQLPVDETARTASLTPSGTVPGTVMGTVGYMAPEQVRGRPAGPRSDLFALGCVLHEMLTGRSVFLRETTAETMAAILTEEPPPLSAAGVDLPAEMEHAVRHCLEKNPESRLQSAADLAYTLRAVVAGPVAPTVPVGHPGTVPSRRGWRWVASAATVALLAVLLAGWIGWRRRQEAVKSAPPRLVVLPFENLGAPEDEYFTDGMTEELTARLAAVRAFRVISRTSAVKYAGTNTTIRQLGEELGVDYVLEGSVRWARGEGEASRIRVTPQLIRVADDTHLWAQTYDRVIDDVFDVQSQIAQSVTDHLGVTLASPERALVESQPTANVEAYQAYLQGRYWATRPHFTYENWEHRMKAFERAVELAPDFALAHAELARGHALVRYFRHDLTPERLAAADAAAARALELSPGSPRVHLDLGYYRLWGYRDIEGALAEFERARGDRPPDADVLDAMANVYIIQGRWDEVLDAYRRAFELSPRDAGLIANAGWVLSITRRYPEAKVALDQAVALAPEALWPRLYTALNIWSWKGKAVEARPVLEGLSTTGGGWERWGWFWQEMYEGRYREAMARLDSTTEGWIRVKMWARPNPLLAGYAWERLGEREQADQSWEVARQLLEPEVAASPEDPRLHSSLGIVYALQGRREEAVREGRRACELLPRSKDGFYYLPYEIDLAHILTLVDDRDAALERLEGLLSSPSWISAPWLRMDPLWDPLRGDPRFEALLERYAVPGSSPGTR